MAAFIRFDKVKKAFEQKVVLRELNLQINKGESLVIIGQSGTGKSVLLKHLIRLLEPDSGDIIVDGINIADLHGDDLAEYRMRFGMLFQSAALFDSMTVEENVGLGLREARKYDDNKISEIVNEKLSLVGLSDILDQSPSQLSGGMRKRVGLARAIASSPEVLLYDEPTTGLDPVTSDVINDLIVDINNRFSVTSIVVTHDMKSAFKIADRIVFLHEGSIAFDGTPNEIKLSNDPLLHQFIYGRSEGPIRIV